MNTSGAAILCLTYILGLLLTGLPLGYFLGVPVAAFILLLVGCAAWLIVPRVWRSGPKRRVWLLAGVIGLLSVLYFQAQLPHPAANDVSKLLTASEITATTKTVNITGFVASSPRLTRSQQIQFEMEAFQAAEVVDKGKTFKNRAVSGTVYVTVPLLQGTGLMPRQMVAVKGSLYLPKPAVNPGGFDFAAYLAQQGIFSGLRGQQLDFLDGEGRFREQLGWRRSLQRVRDQGLWHIRRRIVRSQVVGLGVPNGPLVSAMLLGKNAVDLDYDIRDLFSQVGLAHALAASGFQVSLLLGILLRLTQRLPTLGAIAIPSTGVLLYVGLTGLEPSVARAGLMGGAVLLAIVLKRKIKPLGALLGVATLMLLWSPVLIWDLGFQLSFLATLGLVVTAPVLDKWLDCLPPAIASLISVPTAAYVWTLPLQLLVFGTMSPYCIPLNVLTAPLITGISLGSGLSGLVGLISLDAGSFLAFLLQWPIETLIALAEFVNQLPGSSFALGTILVSQVIGLFCLYGLLWLQPKLWKRWWMVAMVCLGLVSIPSVYAQVSKVQVTVLATRSEPVIVVQERGEVGLVGAGDRKDELFTVLPFLRQQGVNQVNWAIAPLVEDSTAEGWFRLAKALPVQTLYSSSIETTGLQVKPAQSSKNQAIAQNLMAYRDKHRTLTAGKTVTTGTTKTRMVNTDPIILQLVIAGKSWLILQNLPDRLQQLPKLPTADVLLWSGDELTAEVLQQVRPKVAIASAYTVSKATEILLRERKIPVLITGQDGAVQWTPSNQFTAALSAS